MLFYKTRFVFTSSFMVSSYRLSKTHSYSNAFMYSVRQWALHPWPPDCICINIAAYSTSYGERSLTKAFVAVTYKIEKKKAKGKKKEIHISDSAHKTELIFFIMNVFAKHSDMVLRLSFSVYNWSVNKTLEFWLNIHVLSHPKCQKGALKLNV